MEEKAAEIIGMMAVSYTHLDVYKRQPQTYNISTQVPVLYILERVTRELQNSEEKALPLKFSSRNIWLKIEIVT